MMIQIIPLLAAQFARATQLVVYIVHFPLYHKSKVIIVVPSYLEVDSFALLSKNRFSVLHRIKCLKSPEHDIDLKFLECKAMLIIFLSLD
jgi:hypothetical protein